MIVLKELIGNTPLDQIPDSHKSNLDELLKRINIIRKEWAKPLFVTSGYRSEADHIRIYKELATKRKVDFDKNKIPWGSQHLRGAAVDISDPDGTLYQWCKDNESILIAAQLWCEEKDDQPRVHFQIYPPKSGKRFFIP